MSDGDGTPLTTTPTRESSRLPDGSSSGAPPQSGKWTRRRVLGYGIGGFLGAAFAGLELVDHGVLPGKQTLDELDGACSVQSPALTFVGAGPSRSGTFLSAAHNRTVGYTIAYPPGHGPGSALPLAITLHGFGGSHNDGLGGLSLAEALAARANGFHYRRSRWLPWMAAGCTGTRTPATTRWR